MHDIRNASAIEKPPVILSIDTSSRFTSMSVARGRVVLATLGVHATEKRSERLWAEAEQVLGEADLKIENVELFAACVGPGGFTGIRVGLAAVKGLARATGKPVVGVTSLEAAAINAAFEGNVCVILNAYRGDVYSQSFRLESDKLPEALDTSEALGAIEAIARVDHLDRLTFVGDWAAENRSVIQRLSEVLSAQRAPGNLVWRVIPYSAILSNAVALAGLMKYELGNAGPRAALDAFYVRPSEAEIKLSKGLVGPGLGGKSSSGGE